MESIAKKSLLSADPADSEVDTHSPVDRDLERRLVNEVLSGKRESFRPLVERYQQRAFRLAFSILRDRSEAEDVVQESFVKAFLSLKDYQGRSAFYTWLYRIVYNMAIDYRRKRTRQGVSVSLDAGNNPSQATERSEEKRVSDVLPDSGLNPEEKLQLNEQVTRMKQGLAQLSEEHHAVLTMREVEGLSYEEIASVTGLAKGTVMSRIFYARKELQRFINGEPRGE